MEWRPLITLHTALRVLPANFGVSTFELIVVGVARRVESLGVRVTDFGFKV